MDFSKLEQNMIDMLKEEQIKLGYRNETVRLYYPILSLNRMFQTDLDAVQMAAALREFCGLAEERFGKIEVSYAGDRFCFAIPPQGAEYVHAHMDGTEFISDLIHTVAGHAAIDEVLQQFYKHSDHVHVETVGNGEFDYLVYFEDGIPDSFRYCITDEDGHINYHRFTIEDYQDFMEI